VPFAERWNGSQWSLLSTPNLSNGGALQGVACTSPSACLAVGSYRTKSNVSEPLAEPWNGSSWSLQSTPGLSNGGHYRMFPVAPRVRVSRSAQAPSLPERP
jgi:hypothetical protein